MSIWHLLILAVVAVLIFGTGKLSKIGPDLGSAIRGFKKSLNGEDDATRDDAALLRADPQSADSRPTQRTPEAVDVKSR